MKEAVQVVNWVNLVAFAGLAVVALVERRRRNDRAAAWAAASFATLGVVVLVGRLLPAHPHALGERVVVRVEIVVLLLFPYLLYRFAAQFDPASRNLTRVVTAMTTVLVVWTLALPRLPQSGESRPGWFQAYVVAFVVHWAVLSAIVATRLWRAGRGQPSVARRRMHMLATAAALLTIALVLVAVARQSSPLALAAALLALVSALGFELGVAPPALVRLLWRRPEQRRVQQAIGSLMQLATSEQEVAARVLAPMASIVGARGVVILDDEGAIVGSYNVPERVVAELEAGKLAREVDGGTRTLELAVPGGRLVVWTTPYAPFFGDEELRLLQTLGALTGLALDRARLFGQEHRARLALERADELKTSFVALAAHELRTPVASVHGIASTLSRSRDQLRPEQRVELEDALGQQTARLAQLVDQLLDLSRLDADGIEIEPRLFPVRERVEELVATAAGARAAEVEVVIDPQLEAVADPAAFDRIVSNLITNALRYGEPPIVVRAERTTRHFRVAVEDRGPGVAPEFVPDLFERFTRSAETRARASGTGLGLAIARSYALAHRGELVYEPAEPQGARFQLVLPA